MHPTHLTPRIVVYGSFDSAWSYLASRRVSALAVAGVHVDWRAVDVPAPGSGSEDRAGRLQRVHEQLELAAATLLPDECLPSSLAGYVPGTGAAVAAYAEAYGLGCATGVRTALFDALWLHGFDLDDPREVATLLADARSAASPTLHRSDEAVLDPRTLHERWADELVSRGEGATPLLVVDGSRSAAGAVAAVWLGEMLRTKHVDLAEVDGMAS